MPARNISGAGDAAVFDPIGAIHDRGQRHGGQGGGLCITHQGGQVNRFARMICAPVGGQEDVNRARRLAPLNPPVRQVKGRVRQRQKRQIIGFGHSDKRRGNRPKPPGQAGFKTGHPIGIGHSGAQHGIGAGQQRHLGPRRGAGIAQTAHHDGQPIGAHHGGNPQIGQDEPLGGRSDFIGVRAGNGGGQDIDACGLARQSLIQRQTGQHIQVQLVGNGCGAGPDFLGNLVVEIIVVVFIQRLAKQFLGHGAHDIAVTDPRQFQVERIQINGFNRQSRVTQTGQDIGAGGEPDSGAAVADIEGQLNGTDQRFTAGGRQAGAQDDPVALAMFNPGHAQLRVRHIDSEIHVGHLHKRRIIHPGAGQWFVEDHAQTRVGIVAVHLGFGDVKAIEANRPV